MKSDQSNKRTKERSINFEKNICGQQERSWLIADLQEGETIASDRELLAHCIAVLETSLAAGLMIKEASENGWRIGLASLDHHDFHLDVPERTILLNNQQMDAASYMRSPYFLSMLKISIIRALRDVWQEKRHGGFDENYTPESVLMLERVRAADCDVVTALAAWELHNEGYSDLWRQLVASEDGDVASAFSAFLEKDILGHGMAKALGAAFRQWFASPARVNACDHAALDYMDGVLELNPDGSAFGKKRAGKICIEVLSCLPDKTAYLRGRGEEILSDPFYAGLSDPINQSHFLHIVRDSGLTYVQNVAFRDAKLAAKIFPNGEMTPERGILADNTVGKS